MTDREREILRLMHGGLRLRADGTNALLDVAHLNTRVRASTVTELLDAGLITWDAHHDRYTLTAHGLNVVRARDYVRDFITELSA